MEINFGLSGMQSLQLNEDQLIGVFAPPTVGFAGDERDLVRKALTRPIGSERLAHLATGKKKVVILSDDNTRTTRVEGILPELLEELALGGVTEDQITILMALGTHRAMTTEEIRAKLGKHLAGRLRVVNHDWKDRSVLVDLGTTKGGTPISVNRLALEADLLIGLGQVLPHRVVGYSGGGKIVQPGISGEATTGGTHWLSAQHSMFDILGKRDNPVRMEIDEVARRVGLDFIVNTVQDANRRLLGVYAGHMVEAHRAAARQAEAASTVCVARVADIVIADAHPADLDMWQAVKGLFPAAQAVKPGGVIVLVAACPEGVADEHPEVLKYGYLPLGQVRALYAEGRIIDLSAAAHLVHVGEVVVEEARCVLVSRGVGEAEARRLHLPHAFDLQAGLDLAVRMTGKDVPSVTVLKNAPEMLVRLTEE